MKFVFKTLYPEAQSISKPHQGVKASRLSHISSTNVKTTSNALLCLSLPAKAGEQLQGDDLLKDEATDTGDDETNRQGEYLADRKKKQIDIRIKKDPKGKNKKITVENNRGKDGNSGKDRFKYAGHKGDGAGHSGHSGHTGKAGKTVDKDSYKHQNRAPGHKSQAGGPDRRKDGLTSDSKMGWRLNRQNSKNSRAKDNPELSTRGEWWNGCWLLSLCLSKREFLDVLFVFGYFWDGTIM